VQQHIKKPTNHCQSPQDISTPTKPAFHFTGITTSEIPHTITLEININRQ
jgi:hypothetical protein